MSKLCGDISLDSHLGDSGKKSWNFTRGLCATSRDSMAVSSRGLIAHPLVEKIGMVRLVRPLLYLPSLANTGGKIHATEKWKDDFDVG